MECTMRGEQLCTQTAELTARKLLLFVCTKPIENVHVLFIYIIHVLYVYIYTYVLIYVRILFINTYKCRRDYLWQPMASRHRSSVGRPRVQAYWHRAYFRARANHNLQKAYCQQPFENVKSILILTRLTLKKFERNRTIEVHFPLVILHTGTEHAREHVGTKPFRLRVPIAEGSLEVKLPTIWTDEKQSRAEAERRERLEERRSEEKESEERRCRCAKR